MFRKIYLNYNKDKYFFFLKEKKIYFSFFTKKRNIYFREIKINIDYVLLNSEYYFSRLFRTKLIDIKLSNECGQNKEEKK